MIKEFVINLNLYSPDLIKQAIIDFNDVAKIEINGDILRIFGEQDKNITEVFNEFMNYVIGLINE